MLAAGAGVFPLAAAAQSLEFYAGAQVANQYVSQGLIFNEEISPLLYLEAAYGGFYAGVYNIPTEQNITLADNESGVYLGYRGQAGQVSYDASVYYYLFDDPFAEFGDEFVPVDYEEYILSASFGATDALFLTGEIGYAPEFEQTDIAVSVDYFTNAGPSLNATYGTVDANYGDWDYWSAGTSIPLGGVTSLDIAYHDTNAGASVGVPTDGTIVVTFNIDFSL